MAIVPQRRQISLRLPLPEPSMRCRIFPPPSASSFHHTSNFPALSATDFEQLEVLGHGNGGTVYKAGHKRTSAVYALKLLRPGADRRQMYREIEILRRTDSPYVVQCYNIFQTPTGEFAFLMEFMELGTLEGLLKKNGTLSEPQIAHVARHVLNGLNYLHLQKIIHRDIKPANLLVNKNMDVKIADFGVSKIMRRTLEFCDSYVGTCAYMSPERFDPDSNGGNYDGYAGDIWSLGLTLMELYMGHFPFLEPGQRPDWTTLMCAICFEEPPCLPENASEEFRSFVECCLQKEASKRWTAAQLLNHPFVAGGDSDPGW